MKNILLWIAVIAHLKQWRHMRCVSSRAVLSKNPPNKKKNIPFGGHLLISWVEINELLMKKDGISVVETYCYRNSNVATKMGKIQKDFLATTGTFKNPQRLENTGHQ